MKPAPTRPRSRRARAWVVMAAGMGLCVLCACPGAQGALVPRVVLGEVECDRFPYLVRLGVMDESGQLSLIHI